VVERLPSKCKALGSVPTSEKKKEKKKKRVLCGLVQAGEHGDEGTALGSQVSPLTMGFSRLGSKHPFPPSLSLRLSLEKQLC